MMVAQKSGCVPRILVLFSGGGVNGYNLDYPEWYDLFKRKPLVDALLDRLRHHCITVRINGPSLRVPEQEPDQPVQDNSSEPEEP